MSYNKVPPPLSEFERVRNLLRFLEDLGIIKSVAYARAYSKLNYRYDPGT